MNQLAKIFPFIVWFRLTTLETIKADFFAGLTGAIIVLPQSVAFATIAGMPMLKPCDCTQLPAAN